MLYCVPSDYMSLRMIIYNPPTLLQLAMERLLWNNALSISNLEYLPNELFLPLFKESFSGRHMETLKAMVAA